MKPEILTFTGKYFPLLLPDAELVCVEDIAHALANTCRFGGHVREFYSVAQHSVLVSLMVPEEHAREGLMHDSSEAYLGDVVKPLKNAIFEYQRIEERLEHAIAERFGIRFPYPPAIKESDWRMLLTERRDLFSEHKTTWFTPGGVLPYEELKIIPQPPAEAENTFLERFSQLFPEEARH